MALIRVVKQFSKQVSQGKRKKTTTPNHLATWPFYHHFTSHLSRVVGVSSSFQEGTGLILRWSFNCFPRQQKMGIWDSLTKNTSFLTFYGRISRVPAAVPVSFGVSRVTCKLFWPNQEMSSLGSESYRIIVFLVEFKHLLYLLQKCFDIGHTSKRWQTLKPIF